MVRGGKGGVQRLWGQWGLISHPLPPPPPNVPQPNAPPPNVPHSSCPSIFQLYSARNKSLLGWSPIELTNIVVMLISSVRSSLQKKLSKKNG